LLILTELGEVNPEEANELEEPIKYGGSKSEIDGAGDCMYRS